MAKKKKETDPLFEEVEREKGIYSKANKAQNENYGQQTGGAIILSTPIHLQDNKVKVVNPGSKEKDRIYQVKGSRKEFRQFDGGYHPHCSKCPFPEGCVMCTLP